MIDPSIYYIPERDYFYSEKGYEEEAPKSFLTMVKEWAEATTASGITKVIGSPLLVLKLFWLGCLLTSFGLCINELRKNFESYLANEVLTSNLIINEANPIFPSVVFCNLNGFNGDFDKNQINKILAENNIDPVNYVNTTKDVDLVSGLFKSSFAIYKIEFPESQFGFFINEMLISCTFQGDPCGPDDFEQIYDYNFGNCYKFNGGGKGKLKPSRESKSTAGLSMEIYIGEPEKQQQFTYKTGIRLVVHNQSTIPFPDDDGIDIATGQETNVAVARTFINRLGPPFEECIGDFDTENIDQYSDTIQQMVVSYNITTYFQKTCLKVCLQELILADCECYDLKLPLPTFSNDSTFLFETGCKNISQLTCIDKTETTFYESKIDQCLESCPLACTQILYNTNTNTASYPSLWYTNVLNRNSNFTSLFTKGEVVENATIPISTVQQTCLKVNIYYDQMYYYLIDETPALDFIGFVNAVGGNLGLFLGLSILSFGEIFELMLLIIFFFTIGT